MLFIYFELFAWHFRSADLTGSSAQACMCVGVYACPSTWSVYNINKYKYEIENNLSGKFISCCLLNHIIFNGFVCFSKLDDYFIILCFRLIYHGSIFFSFLLRWEKNNAREKRIWWMSTGSEMKIEITSWSAVSKAFHIPSKQPKRLLNFQ